jgi:hypothetical protein
MDADRANELIRLASEWDARYKAAGIRGEGFTRESKHNEDILDRVAGPMDPWSQDPFDPFHSPNRGQRRRRPSQVPDSRMLFQIQRDLFNAAHAYERKDYAEAERQTRNATRLIRRYLAQYVTRVDTDKEDTWQ